MEKTIAVIRGDGIGPEIVEQAIAVLDAAAEKFGHTLLPITEAPMGGCAIDDFGVPLPELQPEDLPCQRQRAARRRRRPQVGRAVARPTVRRRAC